MASRPRRSLPDGLLAYWPLAVSTLLLGLALWPVPQSLYQGLIQRLMDGLHFPAGAVCLLACFTLGRCLALPHGLLLGVAFSGVVLLEGLQAYLGRSASLRDALWSLAGCLWAYGVFHATGRLYTLRWFLFAFFLIVGFWPLGKAVWQLNQAHSQLPALLNADTVSSLDTWSAIKTETLEWTQGEVQYGQAEFLRVKTSEQGWSGLVWNNPGLDLSDYRQICVRLRSDAPREITLRTDDAHSVDYHSRYHYVWSLEAEVWQSRCFSWESLRSPDGGQMDTARILALYLYTKTAESSSSQAAAGSDHPSAPVPKLLFDISTVFLLH